MTNAILAGLAPTHPGEILREDVLPALGMTKSAFARHIGISRVQLYDIIGERKPISLQVALRLSRATGTSAELWIRMQAGYDLAMLEPGMRGELDGITLLQAA